VDNGRNANSDLLISTDQGSVKVRVIRTDEELMIARSVTRILDNGSTGDLTLESQYSQVGH
jgi:acetate kinase